MTEDMKKFLEAASADAEIRAKLNQTTEDDIQALISMAESKGFHLTKDDIALLFSADQNHDGELSEEELENVTGGKIVNGHSDCSCASFGQGAADAYQEECLCVGQGAGTMTSEGKRQADANKLQRDGYAMICYFRNGAK